MLEHTKKGRNNTVDVVETDMRAPTGLLIHFGLTLLIGSFVHIAATAGQSTLYGYEYGTDQRVIAVMPHRQSAPAGSFIVKKYLENRKARYDPGRAKTVNYIILTDGENSPIELLSIDSKDKADLGGVAVYQTGYYIPVVYPHKVEFYSFIPREAAVRRLGVYQGDSKRGVIMRAFALSKGFLEVTAVGDRQKVWFRGYNGSEAIELDLVDKTSRVVSVDDVKESSGYVYVALVVSEDNKSNGIQARVVRFAPDIVSSDHKIYPIIKEDAAAMRIGIINSANNITTVRVTTRKSVRGPSVVKLIRLEPQPSTISQYNVELTSGEASLSFAGVCKNNYVYAKKAASKETLTDAVEYNLISSSGQVKRTWTSQIVDGGVLVDLELVPLGKWLYSFANYSKFESVRRPDGWYSWLGYRVDRYDLTDLCGTSES